MSHWIQNARIALKDRPVLLLHGNVRDCYIDSDGRLFDNLSAVMMELARSLPHSFTEVLFYDLVAGEKRLPLLRSASSGSPSSVPPRSPSEAAGEESPAQAPPNPRDVLARWNRELASAAAHRFAVLHYLDKLIPFRESYTGDDAKWLLWLEKALENISSGNRLVLVALEETMVPAELYTHSPQCRVLRVTMPDRADRLRYLRHHLKTEEHLDLLADLCDGLYLRDLSHIAEDVRTLESPGSHRLREVVNQYRVGISKDYWGELGLAKLNAANAWLNRAVIGQKQAVNQVVQVLCRARAGLSGIASGTSSKPKGVLFFAGPPGVGKTELAKKLAEYIFSTPEAFIRLDMSEFKEEHMVSRLKGAPPGYIGFGAGGQLTSAVQSRPFSVVLFDEIEKAHRAIMDIFLQILDDGRLTDSRGQTVFFTETVIIFTSNIGNRTEDVRGKPIAERQRLEAILADASADEEQKLARVRLHFVDCVKSFCESEISRPELLRRLGNNIVPFNHIRKAELQESIVSGCLHRMTKEFADKFRKEGYRLDTEDPSIIAFLVNKYGGDQMAKFGGAGVTNAIEDEIVQPLALQVLLAEEARPGKTGEQQDRTFKVSVRADRIVVTRGRA